MIDDDETEDRTSIEVDVRKIASALELKKRAPYLVVLTGGSSVGQSFKLEGEMIIGRSGAAITLNDQGISRQHARITVGADGTVTVEDLNSTNGTFVNGDRLDVRKLDDGDKLQIGSTTILKLSYQDSLDEALQRNLYESATRDGLTRLFNKKFLLEALAKEVAYSLRHDIPMALMMLDVDFFKKVNDTHGHPAGDYVLQKLAQVLTQIVRTEDVVARYGGEEFAVLLRQTTLEDACACAERIRAGVEANEFIFKGTHIPVTVSIGVALCSPQAPEPAELIRLADEQLYAAKHGGRNRVSAVGES